MQFLSILFTGCATEDRKVSKTREDQTDSSREDEDKVKNRIGEFGLNEISPIRNGSFRARANIEFKIILFAKIFYFFLG